MYSKTERLIAWWSCVNPSPGWLHSGGPAPSLIPIVAFRLLLLLPPIMLPSPWRLTPAFNCCCPFPTIYWRLVLAQCLSFHLTFSIITTDLSGNQIVPSASLLPHSLTLLISVAFTLAPSQPHGHTSSHVSLKGLQLWNFHHQPLFLRLWLPNVWPLSGFSSIFLLVRQWLPPWLLAHLTWTTWLIIRRILCITALLPWFSATTVQ